ncbi:Ubiquitin-conjugating enzyme E2 S [Toxocara canis]|uniref:E2 ubiquitin-conjugating enzyme n=1 Tax=Toxocara canis TaxID=6265 RepID=A0A0B2UN84_TOXCA|nr:Ubiquitin-conjugating enzyme E2 S [Toxocara canis]
MMKIEKPQTHSPIVLRYVQKELASFATDPVEGIQVTYDDSNITTIHATIDGPEGTPFEGGRFNVRLFLGREFPGMAPSAYFTTKIFHPNVDPKTGAICVNTLKKDWRPDLGVRHILIVIRCLMIEPNPESALNEEAGLLLQRDYDEYVVRAQLLTDIHARPPDAVVHNLGTGLGRGASAASNGRVVKKAANKSSKMLRRL